MVGARKLSSTVYNRFTKKFKARSL